jgi:hypothetical protein
MTVIPIKPTIKVSGEMSPETAAYVNKFVALNATKSRCSHGPMTAERLVTMLLEDVAAAIRDGGDSWQGCHMAILLSEHGYAL